MFVVLAEAPWGAPYEEDESKMANPVVHFEIRSDDPDQTRAFFGDLFGWTYPEGAVPGYSYVETGAQTIPGGIGPVQGGAELVTFFVGVEDIEREPRGGEAARRPRRAGAGGRSGRDVRAHRRPAGSRRRSRPAGLIAIVVRAHP